MSNYFPINIQSEEIVKPPRILTMEEQLDFVIWVNFDRESIPS